MSPAAQAIADAGRLAVRIESYGDKAATGALPPAASADFAESAILLARAVSIVLAYHEETCGPCDCGLDALLRKGRP